MFWLFWYKNLYSIQKPPQVPTLPLFYTQVCLSFFLFQIEGQIMAAFTFFLELDIRLPSPTAAGQELSDAAVKTTCIYSDPSKMWHLRSPLEDVECRRMTTGVKLSPEPVFFLGTMLRVFLCPLKEVHFSEYSTKSLPISGGCTSTICCCYMQLQ